MVLASNGWWLWTIIAIAIWISGRRVSLRERAIVPRILPLFSLVFLPAALILAYMVSDKTMTATA